MEVFEFLLRRKKFISVEKNKFSIYAVDERLEDVLNTIVRQMKIYNWEINDGVVNIFPSKGRDNKFEKLLKTSINRFELKPSPKIRFIRPFLYILPEVKDFLLKNELNVLIFRNGLLDGL